MAASAGGREHEQRQLAHAYITRIHTGITHIHNSHMQASHIYTTRTCMHHTDTQRLSPLDSTRLDSTRLDRRVESHHFASASQVMPLVFHRQSAAQGISACSLYLMLRPTHQDSSGFSLVRLLLLLGPGERDKRGGRIAAELARLTSARVARVFAQSRSPT